MVGGENRLNDCSSRGVAEPDSSVRLNRDARTLFRTSLKVIEGSPSYI